MWLYEIPLIYENCFDAVQWNERQPICNVSRFFSHKKEFEEMRNKANGGSESDRGEKRKS